MTSPLPNTGSTDQETTSRPSRFRQQVGSGFILGGVLGSAYHFPKGGLLQAVYTKVPLLSGNWAVLFGAYKAIGYAMVSTRRKEEPVLNSAVAAAGACGITTIRHGVRTAACTALACGALAGALEVGLLSLREDLRRKLSTQLADDPAPAALPNP